MRRPGKHTITSKFFIDFGHLIGFCFFRLHAMISIVDFTVNRWNACISGQIHQDRTILFSRRLY